MAWDVSSLVIVLTDSVLLPFEMAYLSDEGEGAWFWFGTAFFAADLLLNFFTGYIAGPLEKDHGQLVLSTRRIAGALPSVGAHCPTRNHGRRFRAPPSTTRRRRL